MIADGPPARVLERAWRGEFELIVPEIVRDELVRVLANKLGWHSDALRDLDTIIRELVGELAPTPSEINRLTDDPHDDVVIAAALRAGADTLVTGDRKHIVPLGKVETMQIKLPQEFLADLRRTT